LNKRDKVVYIIPGFGYHPQHKNYIKLAELFKSRGFKPKIVKISWYRKTMEHYIAQFMNQYDSSTEDDVTILGFSLGSSIAVLINQKISPKRMILCSLSPYFKEDNAELNNPDCKWYQKPELMLTKFLVSPALSSLKKYSFNELSRKINCKVFLLAGKNEMPELLTRSRDAQKRIPKSNLILIENTGHDIGHPNYLAELEKIISRI
jgi:pimeloyl-ACP methyl ester carboxylesterase